MSEATAIELKLGDGTVVKAENMEEAFKTVAKMKEDTAAALREQKEKYQQLEQNFNVIQHQVSELSKPKTQPGAFDRDRYYKLLNEDPVAANDYYFEHRFGVSPDRFNQDYQSTQAAVSEIRQQSVAAAFMANHADDFPAADKESVGKFRKAVETALSNGIPFNVQTLEYTYDQMVRNGEIKPLKAAKDDTVDAPPSFNAGSASVSDTELARVEQMSDKELEALLRSKGMM